MTEDLQTGYKFGQFALQVVRFVLMNVVALSESVNHTDHLGQELLGLILVSDRTQVANRCASRLFVVAIA